MIIDMHAHVSPKQKDYRAEVIADAYPLGNNVENYLRAMDKAGVDKAVTFGILDLDNESAVGSRTGAPLKYFSTFPAPATSNPAFGFPELGFLANFS